MRGLIYGYVGERHAAVNPLVGDTVLLLDTGKHLEPDVVDIRRWAMRVTHEAVERMCETVIVDCMPAAVRELVDAVDFVALRVAFVVELMDGMIVLWEPDSA